MKKTHPTFEEAAEAFLNLIGMTKAIPEQPSKELSELRGRTWHLRNVRGPLAQVNEFGDVWIRIGEVAE